MFKVNTELRHDDAISLSLPGFSGNSFSDISLAVNATLMDDALRYHEGNCPASKPCDVEGGHARKCYNASRFDDDLSSSLFGTWREDAEVFKFTAKRPIASGTLLSVKSSEKTMRTPEWGMAGNSPMVTIESSRDARDIQSGLKKMRICTNPEVLAPQPKEHAIDASATEPIPVTVPGDSKAEISIAPSTFASDVKLTVVAKSIDTKKMPSSNKKKPSGAVLTMTREPADAKAEKPMSVALSVSKAAATEFQAILSSMNTARRRLLSFVYNEGDEIALIQHYYDSGTSGG